MLDQMCQEKKRQIKGDELSARQLGNVVMNWNGAYLGDIESRTESETEDAKRGEETVRWQHQN